MNKIPENIKCPYCLSSDSEKITEFPPEQTTVFRCKKCGELFKWSPIIGTEKPFKPK